MNVTAIHNGTRRTVTATHTTDLDQTFDRLTGRGFRALVDHAQEILEYLAERPDCTARLEPDEGWLHSQALYLLKSHRAIAELDDGQMALTRNGWRYVIADYRESKRRDRKRREEISVAFAYTVCIGLALAGAAITVGMIAGVIRSPF